MYNFGPIPKPATTQTIDVTFGKNATDHWLFKVNNSTFRADYKYGAAVRARIYPAGMLTLSSENILRLASQGQTTFADHPEWNVYNFGSNSTIRFIVRNLGAPQHPMVSSALLPNRDLGTDP